MVLIGNKSDLEDQRQVTREEGVEYARRFRIPFFETSAKQRINIDEVTLSYCPPSLSSPRSAPGLTHPNTATTTTRRCTSSSAYRPRSEERRVGKECVSTG